MSSVTREQVLESLAIGPSDFVVEVGGGHQPFGRADLIIDKFPFDDLHRVAALAHSAPVVIGDAVRLPIPDGGCDVLFASHMIEHLEQPERFLAEARRCAGRVYIEFPSARRELMFAWGFHVWLVEVDGTHLTFYRNDIPQLFGDFFHANYDFLFDAWSSRRHLDLNGYVSCRAEELTWSFAERGALEHLLASSATGTDRITEAPIRDVRYSWSQLGVLAVQRALPAAAVDELVRWRRRRRTGNPKRLEQSLADRLMCVCCGATGLSVRDDALACPRCRYEFHRRNGLYDLDVGEIGDAVAKAR